MSTWSNTVQFHSLLIRGDYIGPPQSVLGEWFMQRDKGVEELHPADVFPAGGTRGSTESYPLELVWPVPLVCFYERAANSAENSPKWPVDAYCAQRR